MKYYFNVLNNGHELSSNSIPILYPLIMLVSVLLSSAQYPPNENIFALTLCRNKIGRFHSNNIYLSRTTGITGLTRVLNIIT